MLARRRILTFGSATLVALLSGGAAWAATNASTVVTHPVAHPTDITDSSTSSTDSTDTTEADTSTTDTSTTDTTDTTVGDTTSTTEGTATTTTVPHPTPTTGQCKPGWGYGDKNHCHSGPPGQNKKHHHNKH